MPARGKAQRDEDSPCRTLSIGGVWAWPEGVLVGAVFGSDPMPVHPQDHR
jgi:hypothetical protein